LDLTTTAALWGAVVLSGLYHGLNPGMGWPLAVSSALMERKASALPKALGALAIGHLLSMLAILLPFGAMTVLIGWQREIQLGAGLLLACLGIYLLLTRSHPRWLARVKPNRLALWSFLAALAHGAGLMLVPLYLGLCAPEELDAGHRAATSLMTSDITTALAVAAVHTLAMTLAGGALAIWTYRAFGLSFLTKSWFNLDTVWAASLVLVGALGIATAV